MSEKPPWLADEVTPDVVEASHDGPDFDSRAELVTATALKNMGVDWERPSEPVETPHGDYTPDIMIGDEIIIEVKASPFKDEKPAKIEWLMDEGYTVILVSCHGHGKGIPHDWYVGYGGEADTAQHWSDLKPDEALEPVLRSLGVLDR